MRATGRARAAIVRSAGAVFGTRSEALPSQDTEGAAAAAAVEPAKRSVHFHFHGRLWPACAGACSASLACTRARQVHVHPSAARKAAFRPVPGVFIGSPFVRDRDSCASAIAPLIHSIGRVNACRRGGGFMPRKTARDISPGEVARAAAEHSYFCA